MSKSYLEQLSQKQLTRQQFLSLLGVMVASVFGLAGLIEALRSHAASPFIAADPEGGTPSNGATAVPDGTASAGRAIQFSNGSIPTGFLRSAANGLVLNGKPLKMTGINVYGTTLSANLQGAANISALYASLGTPTAAGAGNLIRFWAFQRGCTINGVRDWTAMDNAIAAAKAHGFRVIPVLLNNGANDECPSVKSSNQWWYSHTSTEWFHTAEWYQSGYKTEIEKEWLVPPRAWVAEIAAYYKNEPAIAMWELQNEAEFASPTALDGTPDVSILHNFMDDLGGVVKANDPNHLVTLSVVGTGQQGTSGGDFLTAFNTPHVDVVQIHDYTPEGTILPGDSYNGMALRISQAHSLGKPIIVGECGNRLGSIEAPTTAARAALYRQKVTTQLAAGMSAWIAWSYVNPPGGTPYDIGAGDPALAVVFSSPSS